MQLAPRHPIADRQLLLTLLVLLALLGASSAHAAQFNVNSTDDDADATPGDGSCNTGGLVWIGGFFLPECTLRAAIEEANALGGADDISFSGSLPQDVYGAVVIAPQSPLPLIASPIHIDGTTAAGYDQADPDAVPVVHLSGSQVGVGSGLSIVAGGSGSSVVALGVIGFAVDGIGLGTSTSGVTIQGCGLGIYRGVAFVGNGRYGVYINAFGTSNTIGQTCNQAFGCSGRGNTISANANYGIYLRSSANTNAIAGNRIGTNQTGTIAAGNGAGGIYVAGSDNAIGDLGAIFLLGGDPIPVASGNLISGNQGPGVRITGFNNRVHANRIGTNAAGSTALPNAGPGVLVTQWPISIGNYDVGGNLISGNAGAGIELGESNGAAVDNAVIVNNRIGVDASGTQPLGNGGDGIVVFQGNQNWIADNVIGDNGDSGVTLFSDDNTLLANWIGTNANGDDLGNGWLGVTVAGDANDIGLARSVPNVIGFNALGGVQILGDLNGVAYNQIGTNASGDDLGNGGAGVYLSSTALGNLVGAANYVADVAVSGFGNEIAFNGGDAVVLDPAVTATAIRGNAIHDNGLMGVDLGGDGDTPNDFGDNDTGANALQNHPVFDAQQTQWNAGLGQLEIRYLVDSNPGASQYPIKVDFYLADASGAGETWLGSDEIPLVGAGLYRNVAFTPPASVQVDGASTLVALATDATSTGNSSEFSDAIPLPEPGAASGLAAGACLLLLMRRKRARRR